MTNNCEPQPLYCSVEQWTLFLLPNSSDIHESTFALDSYIPASTYHYFTPNCFEITIFNIHISEIM